MPIYICINCFSVKGKQEALTHYRCYLGINYSCNFFGGSIFLWQKHIISITSTFLIILTEMVKNVEDYELFQNKNQPILY